MTYRYHCPCAIQTNRARRDIGIFQQIQNLLGALVGCFHLLAAAHFSQPLDHLIQSEFISIRRVPGKIKASRALTQIAYAVTPSVPGNTITASVPDSRHTQLL